jgi:hypothetical protein
MVVTVETLVAGFPFPTVLPIVGEPTYESIATLHRDLNANAASIQSHLGNGQLGLLSLTVSPAVYATLSATAFVAPVNPGPTPVIPDGSTGAQISEHRYAFTAATDLFKEYDLADKAFKQLLLGAVDGMFVRSLATKYIGYLTVTTRQLLTHLYDQYARISAADLQDNDVVFKTTYGPNLPIKTLFDQVENAVDFAAAGNTPYSPEQVVATAYQLIFATGLFLDDCKVWKRQLAAYKTWANFKPDFTLSHREFWESKTTTAGAGYQSANAAQGIAAGKAIYQQDTVNAIANLATATAHDRSTVATLTSTNRDLSNELTTVNRKLVSALTEIARLTSLSSNSSAGSTSRPGAGFEPKHYCWSCGYRCTHYSSRCPVPKPGHQKSAKAADMTSWADRRRTRPPDMHWELMKLLTTCLTLH